MSAAPAPRRRIDFNTGWRFFRGDAPDAGRALRRERLERWQLPTGAGLVLSGPRPPPRPRGEPAPRLSFIQPGFDDSGWRELDLPHDWGIEGPFSQELPGETGKLPWPGVGWYRKRFRLSRADRRGRVELQLDGAMSHAAVWLNGVCIGGWLYGYTSFQLDLTPHARFGGENVLAVRLDNPPDSSRWYPGSGLYRNTWLLHTPCLRVSPAGVFITTPVVTRARAHIEAQIELENGSSRASEVTLTTSLFALRPDGTSSPKPVAVSAPINLRLSPGSRAHRSHGLELSSPALWSVDTPQLYLAVTTVTSGRRIIDRVQTRFGVRSIEADAERGFLLNGEPLRLQGVCMHHDLGALGSAVSERALERQLLRLKAMGCNAVRTAHNPPAPELPELCDRLGVLLMVEAFDCWRRGKKWPAAIDEHAPHVRYLDYARAFDAWHEQDLRAMVRRDRNHPSVVMWSIGNEVIEQWFSEGWQLARRLAGIVREEDRTRPITAGLNSEQAAYEGFQTALDVIGFNYKPAAYGPFHRAHPARPVLGAETASTVSSRGEYFFPVSDDPAAGRADFHVSSYDLYAPPWAFPPDREFAGLDRAPFALGEFVWTGYDYLGEPTPYNADATSLLNFSDPAARARMADELARLGKIQVPSRSSYFGIIDLAGFPKDRFYAYQARWRPDLRMAHILPHWNWPERVGQITPVHAYSSADEAELFLNGVSQGRRRRSRFQYRFRWDRVRYAPGVLRVVTYKRGKRWAVAERRTTGAAARISLTCDRERLYADGRDLAFVSVEIVDDRGHGVPRENSMLHFSLTGPGQIVAVDNGDPTSLEAFATCSRRAFNGLALVILRAARGQSGKLTLTAHADGLRGSRLTLASRRR